jgi:hypothetical protein
MPETALSLALRLAGHGWHLFPLTPSDKRPLANCPACRTRPGHPPTHPIAHCPCRHTGGWCHGVRAATTNPDTLTHWFTTQPHAAIGAAAGPSGLTLIDIDHHDTALPANLATGLLPGIDLTDEPAAPPGWHDPTRYHDGRDSLRLLAQLRAGPHPWPGEPEYQPVTVDTPSGGRHLWYRAPAPDLRQAVPPKGLAWHVDIKAGHSYGLAPGTTTAAGTYQHRDGQPAHPGRMPDWLATEVTRAARPTPPVPTASPPDPQRDGSGPPGYIDTLLARGAAQLHGLTDGRKDALAALAYKTGGYLAWAGLTEADVIDRLTTAGTATGLPHTTAERIAQRSLTNGQNRPLTPKSRA